MILARTFSPVEDTDYERLAAASGRLRAVLEAFARDCLPDEYGPKQLAHYAQSLLEARRPDGSFAAHPRPEELEPEVRTDVHRFVTWAALAFISLFLQRCPEESKRMHRLDSVLTDGLNAKITSDFAFPKSGPAEPVQQVEAVLILALGNIPHRLNAAPETAPALTFAFTALAGDFRRRLEAGQTTLPGGIEYKPLFEKALAALDR